MLESLWTMRCQCFQSEGELMLSRSLVYVTCNVTCKVLCRSYARSCAGHMQGHMQCHMQGHVQVTCKVMCRSHARSCEGHMQGHVQVTCNCCILLCLKHLIIIILFYSFIYRKFYQTVKKRVDTYFKENNIVCRYQRRTCTYNPGRALVQ